MTNRSIKANSTFWEILQKEVKMGKMKKEDANKHFKKYSMYKNSFIKGGTLKLEEKKEDNY